MIFERALLLLAFGQVNGGIAFTLRHLKIVLAFALSHLPFFPYKTQEQGRTPL